MRKLCFRSFIFYSLALFMLCIGSVELFAAQTAELVLQGALRRQESRGAHWREDYPGQDDKNWRGHLQVRLLAEGELKYTFQPTRDY